MAGRVSWHGDEWLDRFVDAVDGGLTDAAAEAASIASASIAMTASPSLPGGFPGTDTGELQRSMTFEHARAEGGSRVARFGSNLKYARVLALGAVITAKRARTLTIPVSREARRLSKQGVSARSVPGLFAIRGRSGHGVLMQRTSKGRAVPMYALRDSVYIAPRPWHTLTLVHGRRRIMSAFSEGVSQRMGAR